MAYSVSIAVDSQLVAEPSFDYSKDDEQSLRASYSRQEDSNLPRPHPPFSVR